MLRRSDRWLIAFALLGPVLMIVLNRWYASLERWYVPWGEASASYFGEAFAHDSAAWLSGLDEAPALYVVVDRDCACTRPALQALARAMQSGAAGSVRLIVRDVGAAGEAHWPAVARHIPATPSVLAVAGRHLRYAGPLNAGRVCAQRAQAVPALLALQNASAAPVYNWLAQGCYCPHKVNAAH